MGSLWVVFFAFLTVALVRRHGWEYVPVVIFLGFARWYVSDLAIAEVANGLSLLSFAGIWIVSGRTQV